MFAYSSAVVLNAALLTHAFPVTYTNCGVSNTIDKAPERVITMNQGATEFLLAMGLESKMVGTAYLDDAIWPKYAAAYDTIPVLSDGYPDEATIFAKNPDFIVASYSSAFQQQYNRQSDGKLRGIFTNSTVGPCSGQGSEWEGKEWATCRPQLHNSDPPRGTYVFEDACEDVSLRPSGGVTEEMVYEELRTLGQIFGVEVQPIIDDMKQDFDSAAGLVSSSMNNAPLKTVWIDCVGRCCDGDENQVFVGGGTGAPNMLMEEAGLDNAFKDKVGNWVCVNVTDIVTAAPDVFVVADASWDTAIDKIKYMYGKTEFCELDVLKAARFVKIPFSATTLGPRNGPAALDLATAALHVRSGAHTTSQESGVSSFSPFFLQEQTACSQCPLSMQFVVYDLDASGPTPAPGCPTPAPPAAPAPPAQNPEEDVSKGVQASVGALCVTVAVTLALLLHALND